MSELADGIAIWTGLSRDLDTDGEAAIRNTSPFWKNHDQGAATVLVAALDPALDGKCILDRAMHVLTQCQSRRAFCCMTVRCATPCRMRPTQT
jgi:hypothetical protein